MKILGGSPNVPGMRIVPLREWKPWRYCFVGLGLLFIALALFGCAPPQRDARETTAEADIVNVIWHNIFHRTDDPPPIAWLSVTCVNSQPDAPSSEPSECVHGWYFNAGCYFANAGLMCNEEGYAIEDASRPLVDAGFADLMTHMYLDRKYNDPDTGYHRAEWQTLQPQAQAFLLGSSL